MKKRNWVGASLFGGMANVVVYEDKIEVRTVNTFLVMLCVWFFALFFFGISYPIDNIVINCIFAVIGGVLGFLFIKKFYAGRLRETFEYKNIECFICDAPDFTIAQTNKKIYGLKMMPKPQIKLMAYVATALKDNENIEFTKIHGKYRITQLNKEEISE